MSLLQRAVVPSGRSKTEPPKRFGHAASDSATALRASFFVNAAALVAYRTYSSHGPGRKRPDLLRFPSRLGTGFEPGLDVQASRAAVTPLPSKPGGGVNRRYLIGQARPDARAAVTTRCKRSSSCRWTECSACTASRATPPTPPSRARTGREAGARAAGRRSGSPSDTRCCRPGRRRRARGASVKLADPATPPGDDPAAAYYGAWQPYVVFVPGVQIVSRETCQPEFEMSNR